MKYLFSLILLFSFNSTFAQDEIIWADTCKLQISDFRSASSRVGDANSYSLQTGSGIGFAYQMSTAQFAFTKNFNDKVETSFNRKAAILIAPDSAMALKLLSYAQYDFDLSELYARRLRKKLYEAKKASSNSSFFEPIYKDIQIELSERRSNASQASNVGLNEEVIQKLHQEVKEELATLANFCKSCKPKKNK